MRKRIFTFLILLLLIACSNLPEIDDVDLSEWKRDKKGCDAYRVSVVEELLSQKDKLRGLSQTEIIQLLGQADEHELYERSQKFFIYYLEPGKGCEQYDQQYFSALFIRFNALDQAIDFNIQRIKK